MLAAEHVTHRLVSVPRQQKPAQNLLVDRNVELLGEIAGIHVLHLVTLMLLAQMRDVISLSQLLVLVAG